MVTQVTAELHRQKQGRGGDVCEYWGRGGYA